MTPTIVTLTGMRPSSALADVRLAAVVRHAMPLIEFGNGSQPTTQ